MSPSSPDTTERSRLVRLAELGAETKSSLLVESGDPAFLQEPILATKRGKTVTEAIESILDGPERYRVRQRGRLLVIFPLKPGRPLNRILQVSFGPVSFKGDGIAALDPLMSFYIRLATGCHPQGYAWAGPPLDLAIPSFRFAKTSFEEIVEQVALAPEPTMWVIKPDEGLHGCIDNPEENWEVGFYSYDSDSAHPVFRASSGPQLVR